MHVLQYCQPCVDNSFVQYCTKFRKTFFSVSRGAEICLCNCTYFLFCWNEFPGKCKNVYFGCNFVNSFVDIDIILLFNKWKDQENWPFVSLAFSWHKYIPFLHSTSSWKRSIKELFSFVGDQLYSWLLGLLSGIDLINYCNWKSIKIVVSGHFSSDTCQVCDSCPRFLLKTVNLCHQLQHHTLW